VTETAERKTKFQVKREATYRDLVDAGMHVFAQKGYAAARVEDIVERTGQTKGAFYFHFKNKLDLLHHVNRRRDELRGEWAHLPEQLDPEPTSVAEAVVATLAEVDRRLQNVGAWIVVMVDAHNHLRGDADAEQLFREAYARWIDEITELVDVLKAMDLATSTAPSRELAVQLFALGEGYAAHARMYGMNDGDAIAKAYAKLLTA
jgi:AcrR family transcriptional regulator